MANSLWCNCNVHICLYSIKFKFLVTCVSWFHDRLRETVLGTKQVSVRRQSTHSRDPLSWHRSKLESQSHYATKQTVSTSRVEDKTRRHDFDFLLSSLSVIYKALQTWTKLTEFGSFCALSIMRTAPEQMLPFAGVEFILPTDVIIADKFDENAESKVVGVDAIPDGWMVRS